MPRLFPDLLEEARRLFDTFGMPRLLIAFEAHDQTFSLWNLSDPVSMADFFNRESRIALCWINLSMSVDVNVKDLLPMLEDRWSEYAHNITLAPADTPFTAFLPKPAAPPTTHPESEE